MYYSRTKAITLVAVSVLIMGPQVSNALVINADKDATSNPPQNTQRPFDDPGWDYVGHTGAGAAVYLGYGYVLAARHFNPGGSINLGGVSYDFDSSFTAVNLTNPNPGEGNPDLRIFRLLGAPGLAPLPIMETSPTAASGAGPFFEPATDFRLIAHGRKRNTALQSFDGNQGYGTSSTREQAWGTNNVSHNTSLIEVGSYSTYAFRSTFNDVDGNTQAVNNDSGGGAFVFNDDLVQWELAGLVIAVATVDGDINKALFGNQTIYADLSIYRDQIITVIPEPTVLGLLSLGGLIVLLKRRRNVRG